ncbi:hypothetical protein RDABS01_005240 [Bienertia sinuspersici]
MNFVCHTQRAKLAADQLIKLNSQLSKLTRSNRHHDCLSLFLQIHSSEDLNPDHYSLSSALTASANIPNTRFGNQLHAHAIYTGLKSFSHVSNSLLSLYAKSLDLGSVQIVFTELGFPDSYSWTTLLSAYTKLGKVYNACQLLDEMALRNVAPWNAVITGCFEIGYEDIAFYLFRRMHMLGVRHDNYTFACVLSLCLNVKLYGFGMQVHSLICKTGFLEADDVVRDVITYNAMINGLVSLERNIEALVMFQDMLKASLRPTELTFVSLMSSDLVLSMCFQLHAQVIKAGYEPCTAVGNAAMGMYADHGLLDSVREIFERLELKDVVSWNTMIAGYAHNNDLQSAILAYMEMQRTGLLPDEYTIGALLSSSVSLDTVKMFYALVLKNGLSQTCEVINALVSAFSKQGETNLAFQIFCNMDAKTLITWNAIISGLLSNGYPLHALELFLQMQNTMINDYGLEPGVDHFSCLVDLLGRAGYIDEMERLVESEDFKADPNVWWTLFSACAAYGNIRLGRIVAGLLLQTEQNDPAVYVLLSNIHASAGQWEDAAQVRELMKTVKVMKQPGYSWIKP